MLGEMLEQAIGRRYVIWNPARIAKLPKDRSVTSPDAPAVYKKSKAKESFNREQYATLMAVLTATGDNTCKTRTPVAYFIASLSTGARPGEMDALRWEQVDFGSRTITVDHVIKQADGWAPARHRPDQDRQPTRRRDDRPTGRGVAPASQAASRAPPRARPTLDHRPSLGRPRMYVGGRHAGRSLARRRDFKTVCTEAGVPSLSLYEVRHTAASLMVDADVLPREVADLLGHKDLEMLVKRYRHRTDGVVKSQVAVLGSLTGQ